MTDIEEERGSTEWISMILQEHFNITAHDIVQDDIFPAVFRVSGKVSVFFQSFFEHLAVCAAIYSDMEELLSFHFNYYLNRKFDIMADFVH